MTVMNFDSHRGWYNPNPDYSSRPYRADAPMRSSSSYSRATSKPVKVEDDTTMNLIDRARNGDFDAMYELKRRGPSAY